MSKVDAQRAMREARYASNQAAGRGDAAPVGRASTPSAPAPATRKTAARPARAAAAVPEPAAEGARCGHKSMNGRACTREAAHSENNHRYS